MEIHFKIDEETYMSMPLATQPPDLILGMNAPIYLIHKKSRYTLYNSWDDIWSAMLALSDGLKAALLDKLELPDTWSNPGYVFNQYLQRCLPQEFMARDEYNSWIGMRYVIWSPAQAPSSLLYNHAGQIIFQVVPIYDSLLHKIPYKVFINNYHPYITRTIATSTAQEWLEKTSHVMDIMLRTQKTYEL